MQEAQRQAALAVSRVMSGTSVSVALAEVRGRDANLEGGRRALVQELTYGTLRHWGTLNALVKALASKPFSDASLAALVAVALYQLEHTRAPSFAVVNHAVGAAVALGRPAAKGLVNALLRRFLRERETLLARIRDDPVARWSYPAWWIARIKAEYELEWRDILAAGNERPPLTLRANARQVSREQLLERFAAAQIAAHAVGTSGLVVESPQPVTQLPGYDEGAFSVQDAGAQLAAPLLSAGQGMRVLDACAAPGGKATHIAELADVQLSAIDESDARLERVRDNFRRLRLATEHVSIIAADAGEPRTWWDGRPFERILADVPCTASGVIRRHPDGKWLRRETDVAGFVQQQTRLLDALWPLLARDGLFLYATCSLFHAENEGRIGAFMAAHPDALREPITFASEVRHHGGQLLPSVPGAGHNQDGFFYALLRKA